MINQLQAIEVMKKRENSKEIDTLEYQNKRKKFLNWLSLNDCFNGTTKKADTELKLGLFLYEGGLKVLEMYSFSDNVLKTNYENYQFFNPKYNTRTKINSETCLEIDKLPFDKTIDLICEIILSLIRNKIHFVVFYAEGQRSPHIRIYDFEQLEELNPKQRIKAQIEFWRKHIPFGCFQYVDTGVFVDNHELQLEFSPHWKYGTMFNLIFEYIPFIYHKCNTIGGKNNLNNY